MVLKRIFSTLRWLPIVFLTAREAIRNRGWRELSNLYAKVPYAYFTISSLDKILSRDLSLLNQK